jgi:hypothetical protein
MERVLAANSIPQVVAIYPKNCIMVFTTKERRCPVKILFFIPPQKPTQRNILI